MSVHECAHCGKPIECLKEKEWGKLEVILENLDKTLTTFQKTFGEHVNESERSGGRAERLRILEIAFADYRLNNDKEIEEIRKNIDNSINSLRKYLIYFCAGASCVGALFGKLTPDVINSIWKLFGHIK